MAPKKNAVKGVVEKKAKVIKSKPGVKLFLMVNTSTECSANESKQLAASDRFADDKYITADGDRSFKFNKVYNITDDLESLAESFEKEIEAANKIGGGGNSALVIGPRGVGKTLVCRKLVKTSLVYHVEKMQAENKKRVIYFSASVFVRGQWKDLISDDRLEIDLNTDVGGDRPFYKLRTNKIILKKSSSPIKSRGKSKTGKRAIESLKAAAVNVMTMEDLNKKVDGMLETRQYVLRNASGNLLSPRASQGTMRFEIVSGNFMSVIVDHVSSTSNKDLAIEEERVVDLLLHNKAVSRFDDFMKDVVARGADTRTPHGRSKMVKAVAEIYQKCGGFNIVVPCVFGGAEKKTEISRNFFVQKAFELGHVASAYHIDVPAEKKEKIKDIMDIDLVAPQTETEGAGDKVPYMERLEEDLEECSDDELDDVPNLPPAQEAVSVPADVTTGLSAGENGGSSPEGDMSLKDIDLSELRTHLIDQFLGDPRPSIHLQIDNFMDETDFKPTEITFESKIKFLSLFEEWLKKDECLENVRQKMRVCGYTKALCDYLVITVEDFIANLTVADIEKLRVTQSESEQFFKSPAFAGEIFCDVVVEESLSKDRVENLACRKLYPLAKEKDLPVRVEKKSSRNRSL